MRLVEIAQGLYAVYVRDDNGVECFLTIALANGKDVQLYIGAPNND